MVRRRKDSSSEVYVRLIRMVSVTITSNITLVLLPQLVLYMAQQYRQGCRVMKNLYRGVELLSRNQTSRNISFLRTREPPGPQECLMEKHSELFTSLSKL